MEEKIAILIPCYNEEKTLVNIIIKKPTKVIKVRGKYWKVNALKGNKP